MSRILIIGGHGKVALRLAPILRARGDEPIAIIRNPEHADEVKAAGAIPLVADIEELDAAGFDGLVAGADAIVWSAGAGGGSQQRTYAVDRDAAIASMDAALRAGVKRYVMVSYLGARRDHGVPSDNPFFAYAESKSIADEGLRGSGLDWTILAPGPLTLEEPTNLIETREPGDGRVSRGNVAAVTAAVLLDDSTIDRTIAFGDGGTAIADAVMG